MKLIFEVQGNNISDLIQATEEVKQTLRAYENKPPKKAYYVKVVKND